MTERRDLAKQGLVLTCGQEWFQAQPKGRDIAGLGHLDGQTKSPAQCRDRLLSQFPRMPVCTRVPLRCKYLAKCALVAHALSGLRRVKHYGAPTALCIFRPELRLFPRAAGRIHVAAPTGKARRGNSCRASTRLLKHTPLCLSPASSSRSRKLHRLHCRNLYRLDFCGPESEFCRNVPGSLKQFPDAEKASA